MITICLEKVKVLITICIFPSFSIEIFWGFKGELSDCGSVFRNVGSFLELSKKLKGLNYSVKIGEIIC